MKNIDIVKSEVNVMIEILSKPLRDEDLLDGWNEGLRQKWYAWFVHVNNELNANLPLKRTDVNVGYGLGYAGLEKGNLVERAARVGKMLMEVSSS